MSDWTAVAKVVNDRMSVLGLTQRELAERSGVSKLCRSRAIAVHLKPVAGDAPAGLTDGGLAGPFLRALTS